MTAGPLVWSAVLSPDNRSEEDGVVVLYDRAEKTFVVLDASGPGAEVGLHGLNHHQARSRVAHIRLDPEPPTDTIVADWLRREATHG